VRYGPIVEFATKGIQRRFRIGYRAISCLAPALTTDDVDSLARAPVARAPASASAGSASSAKVSTIPKRYRGTPRINRFRKWSRPPAVEGEQRWWWSVWNYSGGRRIPRPIQRRLAKAQQR
jgi:hypothetical protein